MFKLINSYIPKQLVFGQFINKTLYITKHITQHTIKQYIHSFIFRMWETSRGVEPPGSWIAGIDPKERLTKKDRKWLGRIANRTEMKIIQSKETITEIIEGLAIEFNVKDGAITDWPELVKNFNKIADNLDIEKTLKEELNKARPGLKNTINQIGKIANVEIRNYQNKIIREAIDKDNSKELKNIEKDIANRTISNFTDTEVPKELFNLLKDGRKFTPKIKKNKKQAIDLFKEDMAGILNGVLSNYGKKLFHKNSLTRDIVRNLVLTENEEEQKLLEEVLNELSDLKKAKTNDIVCCKELVDIRLIKKIFKEHIELENKILIESDKGLGFTLLSMDQIIILLRKINSEQGFVEIDMTNEQYLAWIAKMKREYCNIIPEEIKDIVSEEIIDKFNNIQGHMSILRLLAKSGKIKEPSVKNFDQLTARTIKAGTNDPINNISNLIGTVAKKLLARMRNKMDGKISTIIGTDNAVEKIKEIGMQQSIMEAVNVQGDVTEMYPNCTFTTVQLAFLRLGEILNIRPKVIIFLVGAIRVIMTCNVVLQPTGIFQMGKEDPDKMGLSIGDVCAAEVSDLTMVVSEFDMAITLKQEKLFMNLVYYSRFRDDMDIKIAGSREEILRVIFIIMANLPRCFEIKGNVTFFMSKFLDIKRITELGSEEKYMLLRKPKNPYDITRSKSNVDPNAKRAAMMCYAYRIIRKTNSQIDQMHQTKTNQIILRKRGYSEKEFINTLNEIRAKEKERKKRKAMVEEKETDNRRFLPAVTWDEVSQNHVRIRSLLKRSKILRKYRAPSSKPQKKILELVFTKRSSINQLEKYLGRPLTSFKTPLRPMYLKFLQKYGKGLKTVSEENGQ